MQKDQVSLQQKVTFGRENGATAVGKVIKRNPKRAKVQLTEQFNSHPPGTVFTVPYSLLQPADGMAAAPVQAEPIQFSVFDGTEQHIMAAINCVYGELSPENLSCDGEASVAQIRHKQRVLTRQLKGLEAAMGRSVSEEQAWEYEQERRAWEDKHGRRAHDSIN